MSQDDTVKQDYEPWQRMFPTGKGVTITGDVSRPTDGPMVVLMHGGQTRHSWSAAMQAVVRCRGAKKMTAPGNKTPITLDLT